MTWQSGSFPSSGGAFEIAWHLYTPEQPRAVVQLSHGMCEYVTRYAPLAAFLADAGIALAGNDHVGHGQSARTPEELGYFGKEGWPGEVENMHRMTELIRARFPGLPILLLGHSMGSFLARAYLSRYGGELAGAVICGTSGPVAAAGAGRALARLIGAVRGEHYRSALLGKLAFGAYLARIPSPRTEFDWLSRNEPDIDRYIADPYCNFTFTANGFQNLLGVLRAVSRRGWAATVPAELPLLLVAGAEDPVGQYGAGVTLTGDRLRGAGVRSVEVILYPGMRHEIFNETENQVVLDDLLAFAERCIG